MTQKISAYAALTAPATGDLLEVVDISDTTDAVTGTNKKIELDKLFQDRSIIIRKTAGSFIEAAAGTVNSTIAYLNTGKLVFGAVASEGTIPSEITNPHFDSSGNLNLKDHALKEYLYAHGKVVQLGNLGATEAIDWATASYFVGTLDANVTITNTNELEGEKPTLELAYDGSAQRTITWSDIDVWISDSGVAPTTPSAAGEVLWVTMIKTGTTVTGVASTNY